MHNLHTHVFICKSCAICFFRYNMCNIYVYL